MQAQNIDFGSLHPMFRATGLTGRFGLPRAKQLVGFVQRELGGF